MKRKIGLLIDPDKHSNLPALKETIQKANGAGVDYFLVGGSLVFNSVDPVIEIIKEISDIPVLLFPGSIIQVSTKADGILLLSLISGRNAELLIGNHVAAAPFLRQSGLKILPTGYMLIEGGVTTSVEYVSNTRPIPRNKTDIAVATALAGEMLGLQYIYLDAGSGAQHHVPIDMVRQVRKNIRIPLIVGGGIRNEDSLRQVCNAGADMVIIGTAFESNIQAISRFTAIVHE